MIDRKFFDDLCDDYKHDFDNIKYYYLLVDREGWIAQSSDSPIYHPEAGKMYVIKVADHDPEVMEHLQNDPSRCIVEIIENNDKECPIPTDDNCGVSYGKVKYDYSRHLHCTKLVQRDILKIAHDKAVEKGFEFVIDDKVAIVKYDERSQERLDGTLSALERGHLSSVPIDVLYDDKEIQFLIGKDVVEGLNFTITIHRLQKRKMYHDLLDKMESMQTIEDVEAVGWDSEAKIRGCADIDRIRKYVSDSRVNLSDFELS